MYLIVCEKETGECSKFVQNYVGECGDGEINAATGEDGRQEAFPQEGSRSFLHQ